MDKGEATLAVDLTPGEVAAALRVSEQTLAHWRSARTGPPYRKLSPGRSGLVRYPSDRFEEWRGDQMCDGGEAA